MSVLTTAIVFPSRTDGREPPLRYQNGNEPLVKVLVDKRGYALSEVLLRVSLDLPRPEKYHVARSFLINLCNGIDLTLKSMLRNTNI